MDITRFETEHFFARYEMTVPHLLSCSDCESVSVAELLELGGSSLEELGALRLHYTEPLGHPELRRAIAARHDGLSDAEVLTLGTPVEGIYLVMRALLEPGDEVVVLTPCYDALRNVAEHVASEGAGRVTPWELEHRDGRWNLDLEALEHALTPRTRLVVVNFPHNPTGFLPAASELRALVERVERQGAWLFCDEMYRGLEFGDAPRLPSACELSERAVVLSGLSKAHGLPGLRSGWLVIRDRELFGRIENWKYYTSICAPAPSESLAVAALRAEDALFRRNKARIRANMERASTFFTQRAGTDAGPRLSWTPPMAGSVALARVDVASAEAWCHELAQGPGVLLLPGTSLGAGDGCVRLGLGRAGFAEGLAVLGAHLERSAP